MQREDTNGRHFGAVRAHGRAASIDDRLRRGREMVDAANAALDRPTGPAGPGRDLFPDDVLPEISGGEVTVEHVASGLQHHGALVIRRLLPIDRVRELRRVIDLGATRITPGRSSNENQARMVDALINTYADTGVLLLAEEYVGERPVGMVQRTLVKRNERIAGLNWHQDAAFYRGRCGALNFWTALTPCGDQCPGISVIPCRLNAVVDPEHLDAGRSERAISAAEALAREIGEASPILEAGDAIVFDEMTMHRTSARRWKVAFRDVAISWFFAPSRFPATFSQPLAL